MIVVAINIGVVIIVVVVIIVSVIIVLIVAINIGVVTNIVVVIVVCVVTVLLAAIDIFCQCCCRYDNFSAVIIFIIPGFCLYCVMASDELKQENNFFCISKSSIILRAEKS